MAATKSNIITLPNGHLRQPSKRVGVINRKIIELAEDMQAATLDWEDSRKHEVGVALAAIQIDQPYKIVIIRSSFDDKENRDFRVLINPEVTKYEGEVEEDYEGCLSIKDVYGKVPRHTKVKVKAKDLSGKEVRVTAEGFLARVLQHEIDHTKGKLFIDHIKNSEKAYFHLNDQGKLEPLDYGKDIKNSRILW